MEWIKPVIRACIWQPLLVAVATITHAENIPLEKALQARQVKANVKSLGGYSGFCMEADIRNLSRDTLFVYVEPGRILSASNGSYQDIIVVDRQDLVIPPGTSRRSMLYAFCCSYGKSPPSSRTSYVMGPMAAEPLVRLCRHLDRSLLQTSTVQNAVWSVSNNRNINAVYTRGDDLSLVVELKRLLSALTGQTITPYFIEYEQYGDNYWSFRPAYLYLEDSYSVKKEGAVCVVFTDTTGKVIRQLMAPTRRLPDTFKLEVRMFLNGCASGKYFVRVYCDSRIQKQWEIKL